MVLMNFRFYHQNSRFFLLLLFNSPHTTGNISWTSSSSYCTGGTDFVIVRIFWLSGKAILFELFVLTD